MNTAITKTLSFLLLGLITLLAPLVQAGVSAKVDRSTISMNETFTLTVTSDKASLFNSPDINSLGRDFDILGQRKQSSHKFVNGKSSSSAEWIYTLAPKKSGNLVIPPIELDGEKTAALVIAVSANNQSNTHSDDEAKGPVYTQTLLASDTSYVHSQNILTVKLFTSITISDVTIEELKIDDTIVKPLGNTSYRTSIEGKEHIVYEIKYALFPETSGELLIPALTITANKGQRRGFFADPYGSQGKIRLRTDTKTLMVEEIPDAFDSNLWIAAKDVTLSESFEGQSINQNNTQTIKLSVGDSITRIIAIQADGLSAEQLPPLELPSLSGVKFYPDQAEVNSTESLDGIMGTREESYALIPTQAGTYELPEITLQWWNTQTNRMQTATLPAKTLIVTAPAGQQSATQGENTSSATPNSNQYNNNQYNNGQSQGVDYSNNKKQPQALTNSVVTEAASPNPFWMYATGLFFILWAITALLYWQARQRLAQKDEPNQPMAEQDSEAKAYKNLRKQCKKGDLAAQVKPALINWAKTYWPNKKIHSLADIKTACSELSSELTELDKALYQTGAGSENHTELLTSLASKIESLREQKQSQAAQKLAPLYPSKF